ncbi:Zinc finger protein MAGPIE [Acorus gramineus]|uniref:Protein EARLY HEADING DATE 2 n=1 Tax=Acorus gramineus TaxID=55184 RepID=A0AAV9B6B5_ACOGR|nr:Zinc finger protein MAGPIE [Acorus gramineus]
MYSMSGDSFLLPSTFHVYPSPNPNPNNSQPPPLPPPPQLPLPPPPTLKKKRKLPGNPDPEADVIALSPKTLMATNRFVCEICNKGFQRDQNLQLHRRGHNLPWKLRQRNSKDPPKKRVYVCPEKGCVHNDPSRALGDLTGIKKHFSRKHGEKKWKCDKCNKKYAVQSDWRAHSKTCGTREYRCDCGTLFSRKDSFITHRAFCDALAEENGRGFINAANPHLMQSSSLSSQLFPLFRPPPVVDAGDQKTNLSLWLNNNNNNNNAMDVQGDYLAMNPTELLNTMHLGSSSSAHVDLGPSGWLDQGDQKESLASIYYNNSSMTAPHMSATGLLQKAAQMGSAATASNPSTFAGPFNPIVLDQGGNNGLRSFYNNEFVMAMPIKGEEPQQSVAMTTSKMVMRQTDHDGDHSMTRDFLGLGGDGLVQPYLQQELAKFASMGGSEADLIRSYSLQQR